ncbi:D-alanyl-D-alanine carboxypeptidase family protein [Altererythrobacter sp. GH1-8]|uniref:D-alanyl-D-alanine carboxypeptidase family protein n=1 Tax=Altererythrobacter sp. GH1-8 TaxID=3349333 RepID=UPI00374D674E
MNLIRISLLVLTLVLAMGGAPGQARDATSPLLAEEQVPIAILVDIGSGQILFERNADRRFVPASITKVMTTYTAFELIKSGKLNRKAVFTVRPETFRQWRRKGSTMFLSQDSRPTVEQLLHGITTVSANDGSVVLAEGAAGSVEAWTTLMNENAQAIGMTNSYFANPNGWMDEGRTFVTARDLTRLAASMITRHPELYRHFVGRTEYRFNGITQNNHDPLIGVLRGADGIKTGFTYEAGFGFLGSAKRQGKRLVMVVGGADSPRIRRDAALEFMEWGFDGFENRYLFAADQEVGKARVQNGSSFSVPLVGDGPVRISVPKGSRGEVTARIEYDGPLRAPIASNEAVAELVVSGEGIPEARVQLYAAKAVEVAGPVDRVLNAVMSWFG